MRHRARMTFCKAVYGKGGQSDSILKTEDLNDSLQSLRRFELSPNTSFLPAPAPYFFQILVPSWHCLFQYLIFFSFSPFPFTVKAQWRNNGLNPMVQNNVTTQISSQPLDLLLLHPRMLW